MPNLERCDHVFLANHVNFLPIGNVEFSSRFPSDPLSDVTQSVILARSKAPSGKFSKFSYKISESIKFSKFFISYIW
jgi:hypothetical protein